MASDQDMISDAIKFYCGGQTPCVICGDETYSSNGLPVGYRCNGGINASFGNSDYLCPLNVARCTPTYASVECPSGGSFNSSTEKCEASPTKTTQSDSSGGKTEVVTCPDGYTLTSDSSKCEAGPVCSKGVYDSRVKQCYLGDLTCPWGNFQCIKMDDGFNYCSDHICSDLSNPSSYVDLGSPQGSNDVSGQKVDSTLQSCKGTIYIFNGNDRRCRVPGLQTGFSDCCKKTKTWFGLGRCNEGERELSTLRTTYLNKDYNAMDANCHYVGKYCSKKIRFVGCIQRKKTFCCFSSPLARIIHEQGRPQLGIGWGSPSSPNCRGFTMDEFQKLDFSKIDFSEWVNMIVSGGLQQIQSQMGNTINNVINNIRNSY
jgi:hypothetical protein